MRRKSWLLAVVVAGMLNPVALAWQPAQATQPATQIAVPEGPLTLTITGVENLVQYRTGPDAPWIKATVGVVLEEGAEFRTGPKSAIRFTIGDDQVITLDRLGTVKVLRSEFESGKVFTDLGMKYGRTRYDIEAVGREHDARVRSPSSVLAIRGTKVSLYDQPPFAPQAVSLTGRAFFRDVRKQVSVGSRGGGKVKVDQNSDTPAQNALANSATNPRGFFGGRTSPENTLGLTLASFQQPDLQVGVFEIFGQSQNQAILNSLSVIGTLPTNEGQVAFNLFYTGSPNGKVDLVVFSPLGERVSNLNTDQNRVPSGGFTTFDFPLDARGQNGNTEVAWDVTAPLGVYRVTAKLQSGNTANVGVQGIADRLSDNATIFGPFNKTLTSSDDTLEVRVNVTAANSGANTRQRKR